MPHGNTKREHRRRIGYLCEVKAYVAPQRLVEIAAERTDGMANYFVMQARSGQHYMDDLNTLVRSAYMQAVHDMLDVISSGKVAELAKGITE